MLFEFLKTYVFITKSKKTSTCFRMVLHLKCLYFLNWKFQFSLCIHFTKLLFCVSEIKWNKSFCIIGSHLHTLQLLIHIYVVIFIYGYMRTSSSIICVQIASLSHFLSLFFLHNFFFLFFFFSFSLYFNNDLLQFGKISANCIVLQSMEHYSDFGALKIFHKISFQFFSREISHRTELIDT